MIHYIGVSSSTSSASARGEADVAREIDLGRGGFGTAWES